MELLLYEREELCEITVFDIISGANEDLIQTLCDNLENERFTLIQAYCIRHDGTHFPAEIAVNKLHLDSMYLCFFVRDITLRRQAEEMLRTEHTAIQNSGNGIAVANLNADLEYVNPAFAGLWGFENTEELIGCDVRQLIANHEGMGELIDNVISDNLSRTAEAVALRRDGEEFDVQISVACNRNSDGEAVGTVLSFADIGDRKRAESAIRETERHRVMLESLGAACHHLGQPATVLLTNLGIMAKRISHDDETVGELVDTSIKAAETLGDILHKLNAVNEYKTTQYLEGAGGEESDENRILDI